MGDEQAGSDPVHADGVVDVVVAGASVVHAGTVADGGAWGQGGGGRVGGRPFDRLRANGFEEGACVEV